MAASLISLLWMVLTSRFYHGWQEGDLPYHNTPSFCGLRRGYDALGGAEVEVAH